jgi:hypothetical protein
LENAGLGDVVAQIQDAIANAGGIGNAIQNLLNGG